MELDEALDIIDDILDMVDDVPEQGEEFASSVQDKAISIQEYIEQRNHVTPAQLESLRNMRAGIARWIR